VPINRYARPALLAATLAALPLAGCTKMGPDYERPDAWWNPTSWFTAAAPAAPPKDSHPVAEPFDPDWWTILNDPQLNAMQKELASANLSLRAADYRLAQSRAQLGIVESAQFPSVTGNASYTRQQQSHYGVTSITSASTQNPGLQANGQGGGTGVPNTRLKAPYDVYQFGLGLSWEVDLWGRVARMVEASQAQLTASEESIRDLKVSLSAELARNYVSLRGVQRKTAILRENLASARQNLKLTQDRFAGGLTTDLDVAGALAQVTLVEAQLPALEEEQARLINAIALLLGEQPGARVAELGVPRALPPVPPRVPVGVPGDLVRRRPDIRQAEANLHAATASIGVARADFFPRFTISGSGAFQALQTKNVFNWPATTYAIGPNFSIPIFEGGRLRANLALRNAEEQEAAVNYQRSVLTALHEVDNALTAYATEQRRRDRLQASVAANRRALAIARLRYEEGVADFLNVLNAQRAVLIAESELVDSTTAVSLQLVQLYRALGGGWTEESPAVEPPRQRS
jgi:NodT family efflux transporter outer membrane factor (OMF) lipoprotein